MKKSLFAFIISILAIPQLVIAESLPIDDNTKSCNSSNYAVPVLRADSSSAGISLEWDMIDNNDFVGYKIVISENDSTPSYPSNGYLKYITTPDTTSYLVDNTTAYRNGDFGYYLEENEDYYFTITALYNCNGTQTRITGNVLEVVYQGNSNHEDDDEDNGYEDEDDGQIDDEEDSSDDENDNDGSNASLTAPVVSATSSEDGILISWNKIDDDRFNGYKVVASKSNNSPQYPDDGYLKYITDDDVTSYLANNSTSYRNGDFGGYLQVNEEYYFSVTALYTTGKVPGNVISAVYQGPENNTKPKTNEDPLTKMERKAEQLHNSELGDILTELEQLRNRVREQENEIKYLRGLVSDLNTLAQQVKDSLNQFITYGVDENTELLGEGERAAVIYSYKAAFDKLPETDDELADAIRIANGRWPSKTSEAAENKARVAFRKIYLRDPDMSNPNDNAAVTVMAYGLRQKAVNRNLDSEREGIKTFKYIYGHTPSTTEEWNIMQAITYSGATR